jgi:metallo-beta-lactamase class B
VDDLEISRSRTSEDGPRGAALIALYRVVAAIVLACVASCAGQSGVPYAMRSWNRAFPPYHVIDNIYYVGSNGIAQFLIVTPAGHILLDSGFEASIPRLRENVEHLGFRFADIKILLTSHAHIDHVQGHARLQKLTGAKVVASERDAVFVAAGGRGETVFDGVYEWAPCVVDRRVSDGDQVTLGGTTLTAHMTPGHTMGATTYTMQVTENGRRLDVVFFPSANVNEGVKLVGNARYPDIAGDFERSFARWKAMPCDVFLGVHPAFFDMDEKYDRLRAGAPVNPFIDPEGYRRFVADAERTFRERLASQR